MPEPRVVVVGSINVDLVVTTSRLPAAGETVAGGTFARHGGGKSANQAVAAARLGARVAIVGAVGDDELGADALRELEAEGVDVAGVARIAAPTGVALIVVDASGENQIAVASGANAELSAGHVETALARLLGAEPCAAAASSTPPAAGSPPPATDSPPPPTASPASRSAASPRTASRGVVLLGHEVSPEVVAAAARTANAAGWPVVLNPAPARELPDARLAVVTPNASEAAQLTGERDPAAAARVLVARTGAAALVTLGARGALLLEPGGQPLALPAPRVDAVDTTGAGDTVNGSLAAGLAAGRSLADAARFALAAAALSTRAPGARGGMPRRDEVG